MKFTSILFSIVTASAATALVAPAIPSEGTYSVENLANLNDKPSAEVNKAAASKLLDVLEKFGLTSTFGVVAVHNHVTLTAGQVLLQSGNETFNQVVIKEYSAVKDSAVPYTYRITESGELLPLDLGILTADVVKARGALAKATSQTFLTEFVSVANGLQAGIAYIRPIDRAALQSGSVVKNHYNLAKTAGTAAAIAVADANPDDAASFFTRGIVISNSSDADVTILCEICGHGNPWADRRSFPLL